MDEPLRRKIYASMNLKADEELVKIWQTNDRVAWSELAFDVIKQILQEREIEISTQSAPIYEYPDDEDESLGAFPDKILDDENPPAFYDPVKVIIFADWLNWVAWVGLIIPLLYSSYYSFNMLKNAMGSDIGYISSIVFQSLITLLASAIQGVFYFLSLKSIKYLLTILMEFEYNSRPKHPTPDA